jgi:dolichol-phosphate mannosyltransferase
MNTTPDLNTTGWQVPSYDSLIFQERMHQYALVVPVINEGERIRAQLLRTAAAALPVDVIIADGGTTDGSLDVEFLESVNVRALLTKTGPGRLSAQLRMAYSWCLIEGYAGIVTIDGNGKDNVEAVADFVANLDADYDYIQGSRYIEGGKAINTPFERAVGNRLVHAPLLSLAGRHWFTDTTNGFRAYSARYLRDPRVQPFRDVFQRYELLFYLTVRAGQIGAAIGHVPVVRRYPENESPPTKITGISGKLEVLKQMFRAVRGKFAP